jgi:predicted ester cyclase
MDTPDPKELVRRYYEEIGNQRRLAVADELFAPKFKLFPDSPPPHGPEGVKQFITWLCIATFPDLQVTIEHLVAEGELVAAGVTLHATHSATIDWIAGIGPVAPTGRRFAVREYVFWRVREGKIIEREIVVDSLSMLQQLGALSSGAPSAG